MPFFSAVPASSSAVPSSPAFDRDVFLPGEIAKAAGVDEQVVLGVLGTRAFVSLAEAVAVGRAVRATGAHLHVTGEGTRAGDLLSAVAHRRGPGTSRLPLALSTTLHGVVLAAAVLATSGGAALPVLASRSTPPPDTHLVFLTVPGPGGGGGGGGRRTPTPPTPAERVGRSPVSSPVPERLAPPPDEPEPVEPPPLEAEVLPAVVAPVIPAPSAPLERPGAVEAVPGPAPSPGPGILGGSGTGAGSGSGPGTGSGIGDGQGGGTGGGPYRPGSGITPPRLLREVKATYTEEARRSGITGDVLLDIVVRRDGSVGDVSVRRGLGGGLNEQAVAAVRQWRFAPATRQGVPVDVLVEVAVEFSLR